MATYYAITTTGNGYRVLAYGESRKRVTDAGHQQIGSVATAYGTDIYLVTESRNMITVPKTAMSRYGFRMNDPESVVFALEHAQRV